MYDEQVCRSLCASGALRCVFNEQSGPDQHVAVGRLTFGRGGGILETIPWRQSANALDSIGGFHNRALAYLVGHGYYHSGTTRDTLAKGLAMFAIDFSETDTIDYSQLGSLQASARALLDYIDSALTNSTPSSRISSYTESPEMRNVLSRLTSQISRSDFPAFTDSLTTAVCNANVNEGDKRRTLCAISVAYRSWVYWSCVLEPVEPLRVRSSVPVVSGFDSTRAQRLLSLVNADLASGLIGGATTGLAEGATGAVIGAFAGGLGAGPGFVAGFTHGFMSGMLGGAVGGSAAEATKPPSDAPKPRSDETCKCNCCKGGKQQGGNRP